ncbi:MAG: transglycosylase SLT domain-containing protein [Roseovarius sp.]|nr:transglycosylase SLT domain-containing protein [Roseovarius sp.]
MVQIRKITRGNPLSTTRRYEPQGGTAFRALGMLAQDAYDSFLEPMAIEEMQQRADEDWTGYARDVMANNRVPGPQRGQTRRRSGDTATSVMRPDVTTSSLDGIDFGAIESENDLPMGYLGRTLQIESGGDPNAQNPGSSAGGPFQFIDSTAEAYGLEDRFDPGQSTDAAVRLAKDNQRVLRNALGRDPTGAELYLAHQQGAGGAVDLLTAEGPRLASAVVGEEAVRLNGGDPNTTTAREFANIWIDKFNGGPMPGESVADDTMDALFPDQQPGQTVISSRGGGVTVRTSDGRLEPRLFSPGSGPILQAYNAAASVAALSEVSMQAQSDLLNLSQQYKTDPQGFQQAAEGYIESIVESFDPQMKRDVRGALTEEVSRRTLGILDEQHRDIQRRADNSSRALVERLSQDHADAIASGDQGEIERTRAELDDVLFARENLPGVSWTPAQSENVFIEAQRQAERVQASRQANLEKEWKGELNLILKARKEGLTGANEAILQNPEVWAAHPDLAREAQAMVLFQNEVPSFQQMTPAQMDAAIADMEENPVSEEYQIDILDAARGIRDNQARGFEEDPIARAGAVLQDPPPSIDPIDPANPQGFIDQLNARADYAEGLVEKGYIDAPVYLSKEESETFSQMFSKEMPDEVRGLAAQAIVEGFGESAVDVFDEMDVPSEIALAGKLTAAGGPQETMQTVLRGQRMLDEGLVSVPASMGRLDRFPTDFQDALSDLPVAEEQNFAQVRDLARNIYAGTVAGQDLTDEEKSEAMEASIQLALGQGKDSRGRKTGGIQDINDTATWLPIGVSGERVNASLQTLAQNMPINMPLVEGMMAPGAAAEKNGDMWRRVSPEGKPESLPYVGGELLRARDLRNGNVRLVPDDSGNYRMEYVAGQSPIDVAREDGSIFLIDMDRLLEATLP